METYYEYEEEKEPDLIETLRILKELFSRKKKKKKKHRSSESSTDDTTDSGSDAGTSRHRKNRKQKEIYPTIKSILQYPPKGTKFPGYSGNYLIHPLSSVQRPYYTPTGSNLAPYYAASVSSMPASYYASGRRNNTIDSQAVNNNLNYNTNNISNTKCANCFKTDDSLKKLSCSHVLCDNCTKNNTYGEQVQCPVCFTYTNVSDLSDIVEIKTEEEAAPTESLPKVIKPKVIKIKPTRPIVYRSSTPMRYFSRKPRKNDQTRDYVVWHYNVKNGKPFTFYVKSVMTEDGHKDKRKQEISVSSTKLETMTVQRVKELVCHKRKAHPDDYDLMFNQQILDDKEKLAGISFIENKTLRMKRKKPYQQQSHGTYSAYSLDHLSDDTSTKYKKKSQYGITPRSYVNKVNKSKNRLYAGTLPMKANRRVRALSSPETSSNYESLLSSAYNNSHDDENEIASGEVEKSSTSLRRGYTSTEKIRLPKFAADRKSNKSHLIKSPDSSKKIAAEVQSVSSDDQSVKGYQIFGAKDIRQKTLDSDVFY